MSQHVIRYRRPETPWRLSQMTTQNSAEAEIQIKRLLELGYAIADVTPALELGARCYEAPMSTTI